MSLPKRFKHLLKNQILYQANIRPPQYFVAKNGVVKGV